MKIISQPVKALCRKLWNGEKISRQTNHETIEAAIQAGLIMWNQFSGWNLTDKGANLFIHQD